MENILVLLVLISGAQLHEGIIVVSTERAPLTCEVWSITLQQRKPHLYGSDLSLETESTQLLEMGLHFVSLEYLLSVMPYFPSMVFFQAMLKWHRTGHRADMYIGQILFG